MQLMSTGATESVKAQVVDKGKSMELNSCWRNYANTVVLQYPNDSKTSSSGSIQIRELSTRPSSKSQIACYTTSKRCADPFHMAHWIPD